MNYDEQKLQQQCVAWFRTQYPQYAMLLTHPINEGHRGTAKIGGMHKAEGTVAGVPDLLLFVPSQSGIMTFGCLGIEFKTPKGKQSQSQKDFEQYFISAGNVYVVVRSFEEFKRLVTNWLRNTPEFIHVSVTRAHKTVQEESAQRERERFYKVIGKPCPK